MKRVLSLLKKGFVTTKKSFVMIQKSFDMAQKSFDTTEESFITTFDKMFVTNEKRFVTSENNFAMDLNDFVVDENNFFMNKNNFVMAGVGHRKNDFYYKTILQVSSEQQIQTQSLAGRYFSCPNSQKCTCFLTENSSRLAKLGLRRYTHIATSGLSVR